MQITVLCKVVDNFGDIGVAWRLCRRLAKIQTKYKINLIVDDFEAFSKIESSVIARSGATKQSILIDGIEIFPWKDDTLCHEVFSRNDGERLSLILELFQCGRPDWMEKILFEEKLERTVHIIMIDYLTAEKYAEDFHCLQSLTRSAKVQKVNFMPGFTKKTGGLTIDDEWKELAQWNEKGPILIFIYNKKGAVLFPEEKYLPYLDQPEWDKMMKSCSALIIRGEETMSRACLSGIPFIWQAYPQSEEYHLVKVKALLERMKPHFNAKDFDIVEKAWLEINNTSFLDGKEPFPDMTLNVYSDFFSSLKALRPGFVSFATSLRKNGDLASNLMTYIEKLAII